MDVTIFNTTDEPVQVPYTRRTVGPHSRTTLFLIANPFLVLLQNYKYLKLGGFTGAFYAVGDSDILYSGCSSLQPHLGYFLYKKDSTLMWKCTDILIPVPFDFQQIQAKL